MSHWAQESLWLGWVALQKIMSIHSEKYYEIPYQRIITFIFRPQIRPNAMMPHAEWNEHLIRIHICLHGAGKLSRHEKQLREKKEICSWTDKEEILTENNWLAQCHKDLGCQAGHLACIFQFLTCCTETIKIRSKTLRFSLDKGFWGKDLRVRDIYMHFALVRIKAEHTRQWTARFLL